MRVAHDRRDAAEAARAKGPQPVGHVLVAFVEQHAGNPGKRSSDLVQVVAGRLVVPVEVPLDHAGGDRETGDAPDQKLDAFAHVHRPKQAPDGLSDRVVDQKEREASIAREGRGLPHLCADPRPDLLAQSSLKMGPEPQQERPASSHRRGGGGRRVREERSRALRVELDRDGVEGPFAERGAQRPGEVDHVSRADQKNRRLNGRGEHRNPGMREARIESDRRSTDSYGVGNALGGGVSGVARAHRRMHGAVPPVDDPRPPFGRKRHPFFLYDGIRRQADAARATIAAAQTSASEVPELERESALLWVGVGTSFHAALAADRATPALLGAERASRAVPAAELLNPAFPIPKRGVAVAFSASGETWVTVRALERLRAQGVRTVLVSGSPGSSAAGLADHRIATRDAEETSWTHTVSYTAALCAAFALLTRWSEAASARRDSLRELPSAIESALGSESFLESVARTFSARENLMLLGSGFAEATAREAALKWREATGRFAAAVGVEEFFHGPLASVDERCAVVAVTRFPEERIRADQALRAAGTVGAETLLLSPGPANGSPGASTHPGLLPAIADPAFAPAVDIVPLQWLVYFVARELGRNPDVMRLDDARQWAARRTFGL
jgi:glucosamine--fructose-6-phosphate aminotransferase (isomerizing)